MGYGCLLLLHYQKNCFFSKFLSRILFIGWAFPWHYWFESASNALFESPFSSGFHKQQSLPSRQLHLASSLLVSRWHYWSSLLLPLYLPGHGLPSAWLILPSPSSWVSLRIHSCKSAQRNAGSEPGKHLSHGLNQSWTFIGNKQLCALQASSLQLTQEAEPTFFIFFHTLCGTNDFPFSSLVDRHRNQNGHILVFPAPIALQVDLIQVYICIGSTLRSVSPDFDLLICFPVQPANRPGTQLHIPQQFSDIFDPSGGDPCQIHFHQFFFHTAFTTSTTFDDGGWVSDRISNELTRERSQEKRYEQGTQAIRWWVQETGSSA